MYAIRSYYADDINQKIPVDTIKLNEIGNIYISNFLNKSAQKTELKPCWEQKKEFRWMPHKTGGTG